MTQKKISRRDAIKLLGAVTGATVLANLPSKWSTPQIARGVLPAHAQTSNQVATALNCSANLILPFSDSTLQTGNASASIVPAFNLFSVSYNIGSILPTNGTAELIAPVALNGVLQTNPSGQVTLPLTFRALTYGGVLLQNTGTITITFNIPGFSCQQQITYRFVIPG